MCSSASHLPYDVPRHNLLFGARAFRFSAPKHGARYLFTFANPKHITLLSDVILRRTINQPFLPLTASIMRPNSLLRLWCYINPLLNYLLTYLL